MATAVRVHGTRQRQRVPVLLVALMVLYAVAAILASVGAHLPSLFIVGPQILLPACFALIHGSKVYGWRGVLVFTAICFAVCFVVENIGVATGFPFGTYYFTGIMGPKLFHAPLAMGLAYLAIGYTCWTLALLIFSRMETNPAATRVAAAVPVLAACIMVVWDFCSEPGWATISHFWIWPHGGPYFGVPLTNFLGWLLTDLVIFYWFASYLASRPIAIAQVPRTHWRLAVLSYIVVVLANIANAVAEFRLAPVSDPAGAKWNAGSMALSSLLISVFPMTAFAFIAWKKLSGKPILYENA